MRTGRIKTRASAMKFTKVRKGGSVKLAKKGQVILEACAKELEMEFADLKEEFIEKAKSQNEESKE